MKRLWAASPMMLFAFSTPAQAQFEADTDADGRAVIVTPLSFIKDKDLNFGDIIPGNSRGNVIVNPDGTVTTTGGVIRATGNAEPAFFWGYGSFNQRVRINTDANRYWLVRQGGTERMRLNNITIGSRPPTTLSTNPRQFRIGNPDGYFGFSVGGTLRVDGNQAPGLYEAEFTISLEYI